MQIRRFANHPLLANRRSRTLLTWFLTASGLMWSILWIKIQMTFRTAGVDLQAIPERDNMLFCVLVSPVFHLAVSLLGATLAAAYTAQKIVGPLKRIQEWLMDWEAGCRISPLKSRPDEYRAIIDLINDLHEKSAQKNPPH